MYTMKGAENGMVYIDDRDIGKDIYALVGGKVMIGRCLVKHYPGYVAYFMDTGEYKNVSFKAIK